ncbi:MAG TPA: NAD(P)H-binding protein, partial [Micromonosporaceae bacterium]
HLAADGVAVRALTHSGADDFPAEVEVIAGDLNDPSTIDFDGVDALFLLAVVPGFAPAFVTAAATAGVRRIVFQSTSAIDDDADVQPNDVPAFHHDIEKIIIGSGLEYVFLRLDVASSDPLQWAFDVQQQLALGDVVRGPYAEAATSPIHPADFAAVAVAALTTGAYVGQALHVTGPVSLTHAEQIALIGAAHGRHLRYEEFSEGEARSAISPYAPADLLFDMWCTHRTGPAPVTDVIQRVTGRAARTPQEWAASYPIA